MCRLSVCCRLMLAALALSPTPSSFGQDQAETTAVGNPSLEAVRDHAGAPTNAALRDYVTGAVETIRRRDNVPGLIVAIVRDDQVLLADGFGQATLDPPRPADGDSTMFRIASISKTFTYSAAMQLLERGQIGLDDPVNDHLPEALRVPADGYAEPVRVRHLLSHTAGFEDRILGHLFERDPAEARALADYLAQERPRRVRAPDTAAVYSNYSVALLGALVAQRSGLSFEDYIEQHLTGPLGMSRTTFREPLPESDPRRLDPNLAADIARGYAYRGGAYVAGEFEYMAQGAPAGAISTTAADMARWMRAHLNDGELDGARILSPETVQRMRGVLFRNASDLPGVAHGFLTESFGPYFAYGHSGAIMHFHSRMVLIPELKLGVFVSVNAAHGRSPTRDLVRLVVEHLAPDAAPAIQPITLSRNELERYVGTYRGNRRPYRSVEKMVLGLTAEVDVSVAGDGGLRVETGSETLRLLPIGPHLFQQVDSNMRTQFLVDGNGDISGYVYGPGVEVMERVAPLARARTLYGLLAAVVVIALVRLWRGWRRHRYNPPRPGLFPVKALGLFNALTWLAFVAVAIAAAVGMSKEGNAVVYTYPSRPLVLAMLAATVAAVLTALEVAAIVPVWRGRWRAGPRLRYTLGVAVLALTVYVLWTWNVIGLRT